VFIVLPLEKPFMLSAPEEKRATKRLNQTSLRPDLNKDSIQNGIVFLFFFLK
jgi:hypothetical protein